MIEDPFAEDGQYNGYGRLYWPCLLTQMGLTGCGDSKEFRLIEDLGANRLPEATLTSLDWFIQRFLSPGLAQ